MKDNVIEILDDIIYILSSNTDAIDDEDCVGFQKPTVKELRIAKQLTRLKEELSKGSGNGL